MYDEQLKLDELLFTYLDKDDDEIINLLFEELSFLKEELSEMDNIMNILIFKLRDIKLVKLVLKDFSDNLQKYFSDKDKYLNLINKYFKLLYEKDIDLYDITSISQILAYILNNKKLKFSSHDKKNILGILNKEQNKLKAVKKGKQYNKKIEVLNDFISELQDKEDNYNININDKYGISSTFSEEALREINKQVVNNSKLYTDLTNKYAITLDTNNRSCFEDAFSVEKLSNGNYLLGLYIIDVYSYIKEFSCLEKEAYERIKTIYLSNMNIPMFPKKLTFQQLSLRKNDNKYAIAHFYEISPASELINFDIKRGIIRVNSNFSYNSFVASLKKNNNDKLKDLYENLMGVLPHIIEHNKVNRAYQLDINLNNNISPRHLIYDLMNYLNLRNQEKYQELDLPCFYKNYCFNDSTSEGQKNSLLSTVVSYLQPEQKTMFYSSKRKVGENIWITMPNTIPVRNYASLQNQKFMQRYYIDKEKIVDMELYRLKDQVEADCNYLNKKEKMIEEYKEEYNEKANFRR